MKSKVRPESGKSTGIKRRSFIKAGAAAACAAIAPAEAAEDELQTPRRLGVGHDEARRWSCSQKGYWCISKSNVLDVVLSNAKPSEFGRPFLIGLYLEVRVR